MEELGVLRVLERLFAEVRVLGNYRGYDRIDIDLHRVIAEMIQREEGAVGYRLDPRGFAVAARLAALTPEAGAESFTDPCDAR